MRQIQRQQRDTINYSARENPKTTFYSKVANIHAQCFNGKTCIKILTYSKVKNFYLYWTTGEFERSKTPSMKTLLHVLNSSPQK